KFHTIRCFLENLSSLNLEAITSEIIQSFPELNSASVSILRSPSTESCRLIFLTIGQSEKSGVVFWNLAEPWIRLRIQKFRDEVSLQRLQGFQDGIHNGSRNMMKNLLYQSKLIPTLLQDSKEIFGADGCAVLVSKDEGFLDYSVSAQIGFENE